MKLIDNNSILSCKSEKEIQKKIQLYLESRTGVSIIEEEFQSIPTLDDKKFLISESFTHNGISVIGLKDKIFEFNEVLFKKYPHLDKWFIVNNILESFEIFHKSADNADIKDAIFNYKSKFTTVELEDKNGKRHVEKYNLMSFDDYRKNDIIIIREKRIEVSGYKQLPDFAIYLNGIPFITIEVKTLKSGLDKAFKDYKEKKSYQKFLACIGTDGIKAFITTDPTSMTYFYWDTYGDNVNPLYETQLENILNELVLNKDNLLFYFRYCIFEDIIYGKKVLINHRVQQYYTLKKFNTLMDNSISHNNVNFKKVVKHVQRSGKSITIKSVVNLLADKFSGVFKKIYINVPDTVISAGIRKTFDNLLIAGTGRGINVIRDRNDYLRSIKSRNSGLEVYLMNIQKIPNIYTKDSYNGNDVLIIIDEVHTHQQGKLAQTRLRNFPNASMLTFTATPKMDEKNDLIRNTTNETFSDDNEFLDEFNATDALNLGIVLPIVYEKSNFRQQWDQKKNKKYDDQVLEKIEDIIKIDSRIQALIDDELDEYESELLSVGKLNYSEIEEAIKQRKIELRDIEMNKIHKKVLEEEINYVKSSLIPIKIDFIIDDIKNKRSNTFTDLRNHHVFFPTKSFWCVESIEIAIEIMNKIRNMAEDRNKPTIVRGIRFATDFTKRTEENRTGVHLDDLNGPIYNGDHIICDFEAEENCVDVLIIVGKYLMGYDEKKLVSIYLDTIINEPARLFQLITRPCTARKNKAKGFVVDLSMDERNYETFKKALAWYDSNDGIDTFVLTEEIVKEEKSNIDKCIDGIAKVLDLDLNNLESEGIVYSRLINLTLNQQMSYFNLFKSINQSFKILVSPSYYFDSLDLFYHLLNVNKMYYDNLAKPETIYDRNLIKSIIEETFKYLGLTSINDIVQYEMIGKSLRNQDDDRIKELEYTNKFHKARIFSERNAPPSLGRTFYDWLQERLADIAVSNMKSEETKQKVIELEEKLLQEQERIKKLIASEFNSDSYFYIVNEIILEQTKTGLLVVEGEDGVISFDSNEQRYIDTVKLIASYFSKEIVSKLRMTSIENDEDSFIEAMLKTQNGIKKDWMTYLKNQNIFDKDIVRNIYKYSLNPSSIDIILEHCINSCLNQYKNGDL